MCAAPAQNARLKLRAFSGSVSQHLLEILATGILFTQVPPAQALLAGGGLQRQASQRAALTVPSDRFLCFIPSCLCSAKRGGLEYLRYFPVAVSLGAKRSDYQTPSRIFWMDSPPILRATATGSCLPSPPRKCW